MSLKFNCSNTKCRQRIEVADSLAGAEVVCPACTATVHVPASHDIRFNCRTTDCGQHLVVDVSEAGRYVKCPACGKPQQVPGDPPKSASPQPRDPPPKSRSPGLLPQETSSLRWEALLPVALSKRITHLGVGVRGGFLPAAGTLLAFLGMLKVWSWLSSNSTSVVIDPVTGINSGILTLSIGLVEIAVAAVCLLTNKARLAILLVAWLATNLVVYRAGLWWMGWQRPCSCLGYLSDALRISPPAADFLSLIILAFLFIGSYGWLFWQWRRGRGGIVNEARGVK